MPRWAMSGIFMRQLLRDRLRRLSLAMNISLAAAVALSFVCLIAVESGPAPVVVVAIVCALAVPLMVFDWWLRRSN
jgi:hypothetical protein